jgi:hypothetical protein
VLALLGPEFVAAGPVPQAYSDLGDKTTHIFARRFARR